MGEYLNSGENVKTSLSPTGVGMESNGRNGHEIKRDNYFFSLTQQQNLFLRVKRTIVFQFRQQHIFLVARNNYSNMAICAVISLYTVHYENNHCLEGVFDTYLLTTEIFQSSTTSVFVHLFPHYWSH